MDGYVIRGGQAGYDRLRVLARSLERDTLALLDRVGVPAGATCLDIGCGAGDVTFELGRRVGPTGRVVGADMDRVKLDLAAADAAAQGLAHVEFQTLDVYGLDTRDAYDVVYSRNLLQHLSRPVEVLAAMWRAVRPGGVLIAEDADFEGQFCDPPHAGYEFWVSAYQEVLRRHGGDPLSGRRLHRRFTEAGIPPPTVTVAQRVYIEAEGKIIPYLTIEATGDAIVAEGVAGADEVAAAMAGLKDLAADPSYACGSPRIFQVWSRRDA
jgi:ubiquinone/menaquinone biosynthesis C-methylase UbiE